MAATQLKRRRPQTKALAKPSPKSRPPLDTTLWLAILYFFSGVPALVYQTVWQRLLVLHSGVGSASISIIVAAYMLGLGAGSLLGAHVSRNRSPRNSLLLFACLELAVAVYAYFSPALFYDLLYHRFGYLYDDLFTASLLHVLTLVFPTTLMGMTLPLLTSALAQQESLTPRGISLIYGSNALGAATGALITPWILMPFVGVHGVCSIGATINFLVALVALQRYANSTDSTNAAPSKSDSARKSANPNNSKETQPDVARHSASATVATRSIRFPAWMLIYFVSGFIAIGLEILWFRLLDVAVKSSAFLFGTLLATFLGCLAVGSLVGARRVRLLTDPVHAYLRTQCWIVIAATVPVLLLVYMPESILKSTWLFSYWNQATPFAPTFSQVSTTLVLYAVLPLCVMGPATFGMGYAFAVLQKGVHTDKDDAGYRVGLLQAANIVGCILGSLLVGLWWLDDLGTPLSLRMVALVGSVFALVGWYCTAHRLSFGLLLGTLVVMALVLPTDNRLWLRLHGQVASSEMVIVEDVSGVAAAGPEVDAPKWRVSANGKSQSSLPFSGFHCKLGALPATLHSNPQQIAIIGLGSGSTAWAASCRSTTQSIKVFEICTSEAPLLHSLAASGKHSGLDAFLKDTRVEIIGRDARHSLMTSDQRYDIIETDAIRPNNAYAGYLYSLEFFELCQSRLAPGGLVCCWSPTNGTFSTFRQAFPHVLALDGGLLLIGSSEPLALNRDAWKSIVSSSEVANYLGVDVVNECLSSIDGATTTAEQFEVPMINRDLFPYDEFH